MMRNPSQLGAPLSDGEVDVLRRMAEGATRRQVGNARHTSEATVQHQLASARQKLGAINTTHAVHIAHQKGIL